MMNSLFNSNKLSMNKHPLWDIWKTHPLLLAWNNTQISLKRSLKKTSLSLKFLNNSNGNDSNAIIPTPQ